MNKFFSYTVFFFAISLCSCCSDNDDEGRDVLYGNQCADVFNQEDLIKSVSSGDTLVLNSLNPFMLLRCEGTDNAHHAVEGKWLVDRSSYIMDRDGFVPQYERYHWLEIEHPTDCLLVLRVDKNADRTVKSILIDTDVLPNNDGWLASNERMNIFLKE